MLDISWSIKSCSLFLIQLIWNHVVKKLKTKPFVSTIEAKIHLVMAGVSLLAYPILQTAFQFINPNFSTIAPQFVSHFENLLIGGFCFIMSNRFKKLVASQSGFHSKAVSRIQYYITLNQLLGLCVWMDGLFLFTINIDAVHKLTSPKTSTFPFIALSKFWLDFCTKLFNFGFIHTYPIAFLILFPFGSSQQEETNMNNGNAGKATTDELSSHKGARKSNLDPKSSMHREELKSDPDLNNPSSLYKASGSEFSNVRKISEHDSPSNLSKFSEYK
jgi:hypothetical protein